MPSRDVSGPLPAPVRLPPDVEDFIGRDPELRLLDAGPSGIVVISGLPGCGKTALAVHWAHRVASRFPDGRIYVDLRGSDPVARPLEVGDAVRLLLDALGVPAREIPGHPEARVALYRELTATRRMLVILDDARDARQLRTLLPAGGSARTVVTSRRRLVAAVAELGAHPLDLDVPAHPEAMAFLRRRLGPDPVDEAAAEEIVDACGRLPLALALAAARARLSGHPLAALAAELRTPAGRLHALDDGERGGVRAAFAGSYESLSPAAARLFRLLGLVAGPDIARAAVAGLAGRPEPAVRGLLRELTDAGLLTDRTPGRYAMHELTRAYARELAQQVESAADRRAALTRLLDHYTHTAYHADLVLNPVRAPIPLPLDPPAEGCRPEPLDDLKAALTWLRGERDVLIHAVRQARDEGMNAQAWQLSWALDTFLNDQQRWDDEGAAWAVAVDAAAALTDGPALVYAYSFLAVADARRQRFELAQAGIGRALELVRAAGDRAGEGECLFILSYLCWLQGEPDEALAYAKQSLSLFRDVGDPMWAGKAALAVGWYLSQRGDLEGALPYHDEALALQQRAEDEPNEAVTRDSIGCLHQQLGHHDEAAEHFREGLRLARHVGNPALQAQVLGHLGELHEALADHETAVARWRQAHELLAGLGHPQETELRRKLAVHDAAEPRPRASSPSGLAAQLRDHRLRRGLSQEDLAARSGLSVRTIRHLESGRAGRPRPETTRLLAEALGLDSADRDRLHRAVTGGDTAG